MQDEAARDTRRQPASTRAPMNSAPNKGRPRQDKTHPARQSFQQQKERLMTQANELVDTFLRRAVY